MMNLRPWINSTVFTVCAFLSVTAFNTGLSEVASRSLSAPLTNMVFFAGKIYVGGANHIFVLDEDLNIIQTTRTCEFSISVCKASKNVNKILLIYGNQGLIVCGTGNNGTCEMRNISNIREIISTSSQLLYSRKYLKVSTDVHRPAKGVITQNGELTLSVTFGKGLQQRTNSDDLSLTYMYAVSTRILPDFYPSGGFFEKKTLRLNIQQTSLSDYLIYYKACFQSNWMTYFVTNQKSVVGAKDYVSKLVRICQNATGYSSYTDIAFQCKYDGVHYNLIQDAIFLDRSESATSSNSSMVFVGAFTRGNNPENAMGDTVVCMTELQLLNDAIMAAKKHFATSCDDTDSATRYLPLNKERCINEKGYTEQNMCGNTIPKFRNVIGKTPYVIESSFKVSQRDGTVTTLHGTVYSRSHLVLIFGTSTGKLIQTNLLEDLSIEEYGRETVEGLYPVRKIHAEDDDTIYVMTSHMVTKYSITNCSEYQTCADVMSIKNPLCGWCVYQERATRLSACSKARNHWLSSRRSCVSVSIEPSVISVDVSSKPTNVSLKVQNIPMKMNGDRYSCRFILGSNLFKHTDVITVTKNTFSCKLPELSVQTEAIIEFVVKIQTGLTAVLSSAHLLYFDCAFYRRCVDCISINGVKCHWCSRSATCQKQNTCSMRPISDLRAYFTLQPTSCPKILNIRQHHFIHDRTKATVAFRAANLIIDQGIHYKCVVLGTNTQVEAYANSSSVSCPLNITKTENKKKEDFRIVVNYGPKGGQLAEINSDFLNSVTVYSCTYLATTCSHCQALNKTRYSCDWCKNSQCIHKNNRCRSRQCPAPSITKVIPRNGPVKGGTHLTIFGSNFGNNISNVKDITVAGIPCVLSSNTEDYNIVENQDFETFPPSRLACTTQASLQDRTGMVNVTVDGQSSKLSVEFSYKIPMVTAIYPKFGPRAGGTRITMYGNNLGVGNRRVSVTLDGKNCLQSNVYPNLPLDVEGVDVNYTVQCTVASMYDKAIHNITCLCINMDDGPVICTQVFYGFVADPTVTHVYPKKGFVSGGSAVNVEGKHLDNAHLAVIRLRYEGGSVFPMKVPNAPHTLKKEILSLTKIETKASFDSIEVAAVLGLDGVKYNFNISYFRDPVIHSFSEDGSTVALNPNKPRINVNGEHLNLVATRFDIRITVGIETCALINLTSVSIICVAPAAKPRSGIPHLENPEVNVTIGNIHKTVGYVRYLKEDDKVVVSVIATVAELVVIGMVLICRFYKSMKEKIRRLERPKDVIEMTGLHRHTAAGSCESEHIYFDISEDDIKSSNDEIEEDRNYDKLDEYLGFRLHLQTNETATQILLTETVKPSKGSVYINPCNDDFDCDSLHRFSLENYNIALRDDRDTDGTPTVPKETAKVSYGSVYIHQSSDDFKGSHDFRLRTSPKVNCTSLPVDIETCNVNRVVRESAILPQDNSDGLYDGCLSLPSHRYNEITQSGDGDENNTRIVQRVIVKHGSDYDCPCSDDIDGAFLHRSILGNNDTTIHDVEVANDAYSVLKETSKQSQGSYYIHPCSEALDDDNLLRQTHQNSSPVLPYDEDADDTFNILRETAKQSQSLYYIHPCSEDINNEYLLRLALRNNLKTLPDCEDASGTQRVLTETTKMAQSLNYIHPCSDDLNYENLLPNTL